MVFRGTILAMIALLAAAPTATAQVSDYKPVTSEMLLNPSPDDWLMLSRTYDEQRYSPLDQINRQNVGDLRMVWTRGLGEGTQETIPLVHDGVLYVVAPGAIIQALDATTGDLVWEYRRRFGSDIERAELTTSRAKSLAIFEDMIYYTAPDGYLVAIDARTGEERWATLAHGKESGAMHTSAPIVVDGKLISGRACKDNRSGCFIAAHDARTGAEVWKFYTAAGDDDPGGTSWGSVPAEKRSASTWGLPGSYDPERNLIYWATANPQPYTRLSRHGSPDDIPQSAPADLYSNSTLALDADTGKLKWYYQHLPGDDWDSDHNHERILLRTKIDPDPAEVKWINPAVRRGEERDIVFTVGEPGGIWALDRETGEFLWATPFPYDVPEFHLSKIDVETGKTYINWDLVFKKDGDRSLICYHNTKSYWPAAYHPKYNSIYIPFHDGCLDMTANMKSPSGFGPRFHVIRPGVSPEKYSGFAKVNLTTGKKEVFYESPVPGNGAVLATAGDLIFWGDMNRRFRAFDAETGKILWESILGGVIQMSTITYAVDGTQYIAVMTGYGNSATRAPLAAVEKYSPPRENAIYVFALP